MRAPSLTCLAIAIATAFAVSAAPARANPQHAGIQVALRAFGLYYGPIDGDVGPMTVSAIKKAQSAAAPAGDRHRGRAHARGARPARRPLFGERILVPRDFGLDVSVLQFMLLRDGLYHGALDGYLGKETEAAVRALPAPRGADARRRGRAEHDRRAHQAHRRARRARPTGPAAPLPVYVVQPGDTLTAIAGRFGVPLTTLAHANKLRSRRTCS